MDRIPHNIVDKQYFCPNKKLIGWFIFSILICSLNFTLADELILKDGSRLIGKVLRKENNTVEIETKFAGMIKVKWSEVSELYVDESIIVMLTDGKLLKVSSIKNNENTTLMQNLAAAQTTIQINELAFLNPAPWRTGDGVRWSGRVNLDFKNKRGNTDSDELDGDIQMSVRRINDRFTLDWYFEKDKSNSNVTEENWDTVNQYDYFISKKMFYGAVLIAEHDRFDDLVLRTGMGPHIGYQFFESIAMNFSVNTGILYVDENFKEAEDNHYWGLAWRFHFDRFLIPEHMQFYHKHNAILDIGDSHSFRLKSWTGFRFPLYKGLLATTEAEVEYDRGAPSEVEKTDTTYLIKLGYEW